jgi:hypothetical protein
MIVDRDKASAALLKFMSEMKAWENKFATLYKRENGGPEAHTSQAKIELEQIYDKYVTKRDRKYGRMASGSAGWPPEFDPDAEEIVATEPINTLKVVVETLWTHPTAVPGSTAKHRFTMLHQHGEWRLDRKETYSAYQQKWVKRVL